VEVVTHPVVLLAEPVGLLLQHIDVAIPLLQLILQTADLSDITSIGELLLRLVASKLVAVEALDLLLQTQDVQDHGVGAVEDEGEEEGEAAEVHVALGVEFAGLDLHPLAASRGSMKSSVCGAVPLWIELLSLHSDASLALGLGKFDLNAVNAVHRVDEEDEDEDESDLVNVSMAC